MGILLSPSVTKKELSIFLGRYYDLGKLLSFKKMKKGFANSLYYLRTTKGNFTLKIAIRNNPIRIRYEIDLLNHLRNLPIPRPLGTKGGDHLFDYKGHQSFVYPFLNGKEAKQLTPVLLTQIGKFLGKLHLQTQGFRSSIKRMEFYNISPSQFKKIIKTSKSLKDPKIRKGLDYLTTNTLRYQLPGGLPRGAMHVDLKPENTLVDKGRLSGVVDFDNSYIGPLVFDLAHTMAWFCSKKGKFDARKAKAIYKGYISVRRLALKEERSLFDALHYSFLSHVLIDIYFLALGKLPKSYILWGIDNLLAAEKNLAFTRAEFKKMLQ